MLIRQATSNDMVHVVRSLQNKHIEYATTAQAKQDISNSRMYLLEDNGRIVAMCSVVYDKHYDYYAIKRVVVFNKRNCGKGYASALITHISAIGFHSLGCTPWVNNVAMQKLLVNLGFQFQYIFNNCWTFYKKTIDN